MLHINKDGKAFCREIFIYHVWKECQCFVTGDLQYARLCGNIHLSWVYIKIKIYYKFMLKTFISSNSIGGNAHENWTLLRLLPFIIGQIVPEGEPAWQVILDLKDVVELVVAPFHTDETIAYLEAKIYGHRQRYLELFPQIKLQPKHHYLEHYPQMIRYFRPLIALWTMRFEAKHSFFKKVVRQTNCFKNIPHSLAIKHQFMLAYHTLLQSQKVIIRGHRCFNHAC